MWVPSGGDDDTDGDINDPDGSGRTIASKDGQYTPGGHTDVYHPNSPSGEPPVSANSLHAAA